MTKHPICSCVQNNILEILYVFLANDIFVVY